MISEFDSRTALTEAVAPEPALAVSPKWDRQVLYWAAPIVPPLYQTGGYVVRRRMNDVVAPTASRARAADDGSGTNGSPATNRKVPVVLPLRPAKGPGAWPTKSMR